MSQSCAWPSCWMWDSAGSRQNFRKICIRRRAHCGPTWLWKTKARSAHRANIVEGNNVGAR